MAANLGYIITKVYENSNTDDEIVIFLIIDTSSNTVHSRHVDINIAYKDCYELNFPPITEYRLLKKENEGEINFHLEEITHVNNYLNEIDGKISQEDKVEIESAMLKNLQYSAKKLKL